MKSLMTVLLFTSCCVAQSTTKRLDIPTIAQTAKGSVVTIIMSDKDGHPLAQGSGFFISKDGRVVTNYHVIKSGSTAVIKSSAGKFFTVDGVLVSDKNRDFAIIKAHGTAFRSLILGDSDRLHVGEGVVAIGSPLSLESTVSNGIISGIRTEGSTTLLQITAPISPGSSGGPLFDMTGRVIGITTSHLVGGENLNFAIPIEPIKTLNANPNNQWQDFPNEAEEKAEKKVETETRTTEETSKSEMNPPFGNAVINSIVYFANLCFFGEKFGFPPCLRGNSGGEYLKSGTRVQAVFLETTEPNYNDLLYGVRAEAVQINGQRASTGIGAVCEIRTENGKDGWVVCETIYVDDDAVEATREQSASCYQKELVAHYGQPQYYKRWNDNCWGKK
jgi:hypothetical protein